MAKYMASKLEKIVGLTFTGVGLVGTYLNTISISNDSNNYLPYAYLIASIATTYYGIEFLKGKKK